MSLGTDLASAVSIINTDSALLRAVVQGPASGPNSTVVIPNTGALVKTLSRVAAEAAGPYALKAGDTFTGVLRIQNPSHDQFYINQVDPAYNLDIHFMKTGIRQWMLSARTSGAIPDFWLFNWTREQLDLMVSGQTGYLGLGGGTTPGARLQLQNDRHEFLAFMQTNAASYNIDTTYWGNGVAKWLQSVRLSAGTDDFKWIHVPSGRETLALSASTGDVTVFGHLLPFGDGQKNYGSASRRGATAYFTTGAINTSDVRHKRWGSLLSDQPGLVKVGLMIPEIVGTFQLLQSIREKGQAAYDALTPEQQAATSVTELGEGLARWHIGLTVQELVAIFDTVRISHPEMPTPAQLGLYGRDDIKTRVPRVVKDTRQRMVAEPYTDVEYALAEGGDYFIAHTVTKTRMVPAPPVLKPVLLPGGAARMVKTGERPTGLMDEHGRPIMEPVYGPEMRPVPATDEIDVTVYDEVDQGEYILSVRPEQIHYLCIGAAHIARRELAAKVDAQEARIAALEAA